MIDLFVQIVYQPFLNLVVFFYWLLGQTPIGYDMGIAVILLTITIRILLLPLTIASFRTEDERREIEDNIKAIKEKYAHYPVERKAAIKEVLRAKPRMLFSEATMFFIQMIIAFILWRIFASGLPGKDLHLIYDFLPEVPQPFTLTFLGKFDLTHPDLQLNLVQTLLIFCVETFGVLTSPYKVSQEEVVRVQVILPIMSFVIFAFLPAGKKLFVITALTFSLLIMILRQIVHVYRQLFPPEEPEEVVPPVAETPAA